MHPGRGAKVGTTHLLMFSGLNAPGLRPRHIRVQVEQHGTACLNKHPASTSAILTSQADLRGNQEGTYARAWIVANMLLCCAGLCEALSTATRAGGSLPRHLPPQGPRGAQEELGMPFHLRNPAKLTKDGSRIQSERALCDLPLRLSMQSPEVDKKAQKL